MRNLLFVRLPDLQANDSYSRWSIARERAKATLRSRTCGLSQALFTLQIDYSLELGVHKLLKQHLPRRQQPKHLPASSPPRWAAGQLRS